MLKEYHAGALDQAEARELVGSLFLVGPGHQFDPELDAAAGDVTTAPGDPFQGVEQAGEEQKHVVAGGEEQKHVVARAVSPEAEEPGPTQPKVETNVVLAKVGE